MIISEPRKSVRQGEVFVEAVVTFDRPRGNVPPTVWFAFPERCAPWVATHGDGFAAAMLPLAMRSAEPLQVDADLSPRLVRGIREYQQFQSVWRPDRFTPVDVRCTSMTARDPRDGAGATGTTFSGGVDSFHTLWTHLPQNEPLEQARVTHCVTINGFDPDWDLDDGEHFAALQRLYDGVASRAGVEAIVMRTNLLRFLGRLLLKESYPTFLATPALILGRLFARYYIPSSYCFLHASLRDASHPAFDHLIATEATEIIHDAAHLTRVQKTIEISRWPETYDVLRPCLNETGVGAGGEVVANCCECEKCVETMATLEIAGTLKPYRAFSRPWDNRLISRLEFRDAGYRAFSDEIIAFALENGRPEIARAMRRSRQRVRYAAPLLIRLILANKRLEAKSRLWAAILRGPRRIAKSIGIGAGWLYRVSEKGWRGAPDEGRLR